MPPRVRVLDFLAPAYYRMRFEDGIADFARLKSADLCSYPAGNGLELMTTQEALRHACRKIPDLAEPALDAIRRFHRSRFTLRVRGRELVLGWRTLLMGVLNVTPDSFSDGGLFLSGDAAVEHGRKMIEAGADIIDIGGESTRPGAQPVSAADELSRILPVIERLRAASDVLISVDTYKSAVAREALSAGADLVNDISGFRADEAMAELVAEAGCPVIIMHIKGTPRDMQQNPTYEHLISEIYWWLADSIRLALDAGVAEDQVIIDPGIGFGKTADHNLQILGELRQFRSLGRPILVGASRKSFIGKLLDKPPLERGWGTAAAVAAAILNGARIVRVHDVAEMHDVARVADAIRCGSTLLAR